MLYNVSVSSSRSSQTWNNGRPFSSEDLSEINDCRQLASPNLSMIDESYVSILHELC